MAGDWIKIETGLPQKPEVMRMAEIMDLDEIQVVGHLVLFWSWCDANLSRDCPDVIGTKKGIDRAAGGTGFVDAMLQVGWLQEITIDGVRGFRIPNFDHHLSKSAKTRANEQKKKQRQRVSKQKESPECPDVNGTTPGPEKRREEKRTIYIHPDVIVPSSLDRPDVIEAVQAWKSYLDESHLKVIPDNSPQDQMLWDMLNRFGGPEIVIEQIQQAMASGWANLRKPEPSGNSHGSRKHTRTHQTAAQRAEQANADAFAALQFADDD